MSQSKEESINKGNRINPYASCENCCRVNSTSRWGCNWRSELAMQEDKSPCLIWDDGKDN